MQLGIQNKVAVVTGATQGIGYAIASTLLAEGVTVVVNGRRSDQVDQAVARLKAEHGAAAPVQGVVADLASAAGCNVLLAQVPACDILVNNAAVFETADFFEIADDTWDTYWAVNIMAGMRLARSYLPAMAGKATPAVTALTKAGVAHTLHEYDHTAAPDVGSIFQSENTAACRKLPGSLKKVARIMRGRWSLAPTQICACVLSSAMATMSVGVSPTTTDFPTTNASRR